MIFRLEIENFYSIKECQTIDLVAGKSASDEFGHLAPTLEGSEERVPRVLAIIGANAAGKSNVLRALVFVSWFVKASFATAPGANLLLPPFHDDDGSKRNSRIAVWFAGPADPNDIGNSSELSSKYKYEVVLSALHEGAQKVVSETLSYWRADSRRHVTLISRNESGQVKANKDFGLSGYQNALENILRPNVSVFSTLAQLNHPLALRLVGAASNVYSNIFLFKTEFDNHLTASTYKDDSVLLESLNEEIERVDFGVERLDVQLSGEVPSILFRHKGLSTPLNMTFESHGTQQFVKLFPLIFWALKTGGLAVIDELDLSIHPLVLPEILSWFYDSERNPYGAQLWFTGQNVSILETLVKEEVLLCSKSKRGQTEIYGLKDIQGVRREDNFYKKYLGGVYGAIPRLG